MSFPPGISVQELKQRLDRGDAPVLLDVREPSEVAICVLPGAITIPKGDIPARLTELEEHVDDELVIYCHHGIRSYNVQQFLLRQGFTGVRNLAGGIEEWAATVDPTMARY